MSRPLSFADAAMELRMSERWLRDWLAANPVDSKGVPFYIPKGRKKEFNPTDIDRINEQLRENERCRLKFTGAATSSITGELLGRVAAGKGLPGRASLRTKTSPRAKLPKSKRGIGMVISLVREQS